MSEHSSQDDDDDDDDIKPNRVADRNVDEFLGYCRSIAEKDELDSSDVVGLQGWLRRQRHVKDVPFLSDVADAVLDIRTGRESPDDLGILHSELRRLVGASGSSRAQPTSLPLDDPTPIVSFEGKRFCFTGTFDFGTRDTCVRETILRGAYVGRSVSRKTDYLVIGSNVTETWKHSSFGNKIIKATRWREDLVPIAIISEDCWSEALLAHSNKTLTAAAHQTRQPVARTQTWGGGAPTRVARSFGPGRRTSRKLSADVHSSAFVSWLTAKPFPVWYFPTILFFVSFFVIWILRH